MTQQKKLENEIGHTENN